MIWRHGLVRTRAYKSWAKMKERCLNPKCREYAYYGGRGISVCSGWLNFRNFYADMGECPPGRSIDRIDNDGNYEPENCRWADVKTQCRNRRSNVVLTFLGKTQTLIEWSEETGLSQSTLEHRVKRGWSVERALTQPHRYDLEPGWRKQ